MVYLVPGSQHTVSCRVCVLNYNAALTLVTAVPSTATLLPRESCRRRSISGFLNQSSLGCQQLLHDRLWWAGCCLLSFGSSAVASCFHDLKSTVTVIKRWLTAVVYAGTVFTLGSHLVLDQKAQKDSPI